MCSRSLRSSSDRTIISTRSDIPPFPFPSSSSSSSPSPSPSLLTNRKAPAWTDVCSDLTFSSPLQQSAKDGYRSYLQAYASHSLRSVFDVHKLDLVKVAKSFGFATPPRVDITLGASMSRDKKNKVGARRAYGVNRGRNGRLSGNERRMISLGV